METTKRTLPERVWSNHKDAIHRLIQLYCDKGLFASHLLDLRASRLRLIVEGARIVLHVTPYVFILSLLGRLVASTLVGAPFDSIVYVIGTGLGIVYGVGFGSMLGITVGSAKGILTGLMNAIITGIPAGITVGIGFGAVSGIVDGTPLSIVLGTCLGLAYGLTEKVRAEIISEFYSAIIYGVIVGVVTAVTNNIEFGIGAGAAFALAYFAALLRLHNYLIHGAFVWPRVKGSWYPRHPLNWDSNSPLPFWRLDKVLLSYVASSPEAGREEVKRLIHSDFYQAGAAWRVQTALIIRSSGRITDLRQLELILGTLPVGEKGYLSQTKEVYQKGYEIAAQQDNYLSELGVYFRVKAANQQVALIESFIKRIPSYDEPLASELKDATKTWLELAKKQLEEAQVVMGR